MEIYIMSHETNAAQVENSTRFDQLKESLKDTMQGAMALGAVAIAAMSAAPNQAEAQTAASPQPVVAPAAGLAPTLTITARFGSTEASAEDISSSRVTVLENIKASGTPKKLVKKAERNGDCFNVGKGTKYPKFWNQGRNVNSTTKFGLDSRFSRVCEIGGKLIRIACNNEVRLRNKPSNSVETPVVFVKSFAKTNVQVSAVALAVAECTEGGASAFAFGYGSATGSVNARTLVRGKGRGKTATQIGVQANASADASAKAKVKCESANVTVTVAEKPQELPPKDSPQPAPEPAPAPAPAPVPKDDPTPPAGAPS